MDTDKNEDTLEAAYDTLREEKVSELEILKQSLEDKKKQALDYYDQLLRLKAEFENFRQRSEREKMTHRLWGKEEILYKQINLLDVIEQAYQSVNATVNIESMRKGLELIKIEFAKMLTGEGVTEIECQGKPFDPHRHEALDMVNSAEPDGTILNVVQKGYIFNDRVLRPARVRVAKNTEKKDSTQEKQQQETQQ